MVDVLGILKTIYGLATEIQKLVAKIHENHEECSKLLKLIARVSAIVNWLQQLLLTPTSSSSSSSTTLEGDDHPMSGALMDLKDALNHGQSVVKNCQGENAPMRALNANHIAAKLRRVWEDVSTNLDIVVFAAVVYHSSVMAKMNAHVKDLVNAIRARDAKLPNLSKPILDFHLGDGLVPPQVEKSVQTYCTSIRNASSAARDASSVNSKQPSLSQQFFHPGDDHVPPQKSVQMCYTSIRNASSAARDASSVNSKQPILSQQIFHPGDDHVPPQVEKSVQKYWTSIGYASSRMSCPSIRYTSSQTSGTTIRYASSHTTCPSIRNTSSQTFCN